MLSTHISCRTVSLWKQTISLRNTEFKIHAYTPCEISVFLRTRPWVQRISSLPDTNEHTPLHRLWCHSACDTFLMDESSTHAAVRPWTRFSTSSPHRWPIA